MQTVYSVPLFPIHINCDMRNKHLNGEIYDGYMYKLGQLIRVISNMYATICNQTVRSGSGYGTLTCCSPHVDLTCVYSYPLLPLLTLV